MNKFLEDIIEDYDGEAEELFNEADIEAGEKVDILETICTVTEATIFLDRKEWIND